MAAEATMTTSTAGYARRRVRPEKVQAVEKLAERFRRAQALVFTDFRGLSAPEMVDLRRELKKNGLEYKVVKNRLAKLAAEKVGLTIDPLLEGPTGICFGYDDPALAFKICAQLAKQFEHYTIKGGLIEGQLVDAQEALELAKLPTRQELLAQLAGALQGPIQALALTLNGLLRQLVVVLHEVAKVKPETAEGAQEAQEAQQQQQQPAQADQEQEQEQEQEQDTQGKGEAS